MFQERGFSPEHDEQILNKPAEEDDPELADAIAEASSADIELREKLGTELHAAYKRIEAIAISTATAEVEQRYRKVLDEADAGTDEARYEHIRACSADLARDVAKQALSSIAESDELRLLRSNRELLEYALDTTRTKLLPVLFTITDGVLATRMPRKTKPE